MRKDIIHQEFVHRIINLNKMSWNPPKDKNKEQPKRRGVKGK